jgi:hypothetical protein
MPVGRGWGLYLGLQQLAQALQAKREREILERTREKAGEAINRFARPEVQFPEGPQREGTPTPRPDQSMTPQQYGLNQQLGMGQTYSDLLGFPGALNTAIGLRQAQQPDYTQKEVGDYLVTSEQRSGQPPRIINRELFPRQRVANVNPQRRAVLDKTGQPVFEKRGGVTLQKYELIDSNNPDAAPIGYEYTKIDDQSSKDPNVGNIKIGIIRNFNADPQVRKTQSMIDGARIVTDILDTDNPIGDAAIATFMARNSGEVGALTEADKAPFGGSRALDAKVAQVATNLATGKLTDENRKFVGELAQVMKKAAEKNFDRHAKKYAKQYSGASKDLVEGDIFDMLNPDFLPEASQKMNKTEFIKDFQKEEGRPPTGAELEKLRQLGEWE